MTKELRVSVDEKLVDALNVVTKQLQSIKSLKNTETKTSGIFKYNPNSTWEDRIFKLTDISKLIEISSFLISKRNGYELAAKELELDSYPLFKWCGYSVEEWIHDIKLRIDSISNDEKYEKLVDYKNRMDYYLTYLEQFQTQEMKALSLLNDLKENFGV